jgi:hypothetical protein
MCRTPLPPSRTSSNRAARRRARTFQSPAQHAFLDEAELARNSQAPLVRRVDLDVDADEAALLEADACQHRGHLPAEAMPDRVRADPVADLERSLTAARMETGTAELA